MLEKIKKTFIFEKVIQRLFASWLFSATLFIYVYPGALDRASFPTQIGLFTILACTAAFFAGITVINAFLSNKLDSFMLLVAVLVYTVSTAVRFRDAFYTTFMIGIIAICLYQLIQKDGFTLKVDMTKRSSVSITAVFGVFIIAFIGTTMTLRYLCYASPNFDFGLFVNMFHNMKTKLQPLVTSERDVLMSHFGVHISPIWYLLLPFYAIFPSPITLQIGQAVIVGIGIIPVYLIAKRKGVSNTVTTLLCIAYAFHPALAGGCFYDIHENCFLIPLLLWLFYFFESMLQDGKKRYTVLMYVFMVLVMLVKEDAPLYIALFALYIMLGHKKFKHGIIMFISSVAYFCLALWLLSKFGLGAMTSSRFGSYTVSESTSMFEVAKNILADPAMLIDNIFNADKVVFLFEMFASLAFVPMMTKKVSRYILLFPLIVENLMPNYKYQYSIHYQYVFGPLAFIIYLTILNAADIKFEKRKMVAILVAISSIMMFMSQDAFKIRYVSQYIEEKADCDQMTEVLKTIPKNASLRASTFLIAHVADRDEIYELQSTHYTDYVAIDLRYPKQQNAQERFDEYSSSDKWIREQYIPGLVAVFRNITYTPAE